MVTLLTTGAFLISIRWIALSFFTFKIGSMNPESLLYKLTETMNTHDINAFVACFAEDYSSEQPSHPDRTFKGREQVSINWSANFNEMPDFSARLLRHSINNESIWAEWEWRGTRKDHSELFMRGVMIMGVQDDKIAWGRLYVEPVEINGKGIEAAVKAVMHGKTNT